MIRFPNTTRNGNAWSEEQKKEVWNKARTIAGYPVDVWRQDKCGHTMLYSEYGNRQSKQGWEIDHIHPVAHGGSDALINLQPLYWGNNASKGDSMYWNCGQ